MSLSSSSTGHTFMALLFIRLPKELITWPIETLLVLVILRQLSRLNLIKFNCKKERKINLFKKVLHFK